MMANSHSGKQAVDQTGAQQWPPDCPFPLGHSHTGGGGPSLLEQSFGAELTEPLGDWSHAGDTPRGWAGGGVCSLGAAP